ncbi:hypothetical protein [Paractinoplanes atraurantiacus]|uniref:Uncharacterized protein n=1 Tax=Paractinoplanes atraurantiacus TaxID=1036182 RepID=A0A285F6T4_9ACTN|nr:hypothetical protein [Actinoplanes atraurantiacus]SNY06414.1 hypothetical protein SAMN05421748_101715 [Actinoplanes atraurantiacus]
MAWRTAITTAATLFTACVVAASGQAGTPTEQAMLLSHGDRDGGGNVRFVLSGESVTGLYPGITRKIKVTVANPFDYPIALRGLEGRLVGTARRDCPATPASLRVGTYSGRLPIILKPYHRTTLPGSIPVTMPRNAASKCANTRFAVALTGVAGRVAR